MEDVRKAHEKLSIPNFLRTKMIRTKLNTKASTIWGITSLSKRTLRSRSIDGMVLKDERNIVKTSTKRSPVPFSSNLKKPAISSFKRKTTIKIAKVTAD